MRRSWTHRILVATATTIVDGLALYAATADSGPAGDDRSPSATDPLPSNAVASPREVSMEVARLSGAAFANCVPDEARPTLYTCQTFVAVGDGKGRRAAAQQDTGAHDHGAHEHGADELDAEERGTHEPGRTYTAIVDGDTTEVRLGRDSPAR